jgi:pantoate--beta-alanine ligase
MVVKPNIVRTERALRSRVSSWRDAGESVALVPTMGALHEGHLHLIDLATRKADRTIVSVFVNPGQFAPKEDFDKYPRDEKSDIVKLAEFGVDLVFAPSIEMIYPSDFATKVILRGPATADLEDGPRPHFFDGVTTVVAKLLILCQPHMAIFGEKDFQQFLVVQQMARDLNIPVKILAGTTIREPDGLALSSRNAYLSPDERLIAPMLHAVLKDVAHKVARGGDVNRVLGTAKTKLGRSGFRLDYLEARDSKTLQPLAKDFSGNARLLVAAWLGKTRLIDNISLKI